MSETVGIINKWIPFSAVDGPGNRFALFLQGCPFNCWYCHNPETIHDCVGCGDCVTACPSGALSLDGDGSVLYDSEVCLQCDTCLRVCPNNSSPKTRRMTATDIMTEVAKVRPFIRGITVSGGECTLQKEFLVELFALAKAGGLDCLVDSNGGTALWEMPDLMALTDGVMLDVKASDDKVHRSLTGLSSEIPLRNLDFLAKSGKLQEVRTVVSVTNTDAATTIRFVAERLAKLDPTVRYKLIKYRHLGVREEYLERLETPSQTFMEELAATAKSFGLTDVVIT